MLSPVRTGALVLLMLPLIPTACTDRADGDSARTGDAVPGGDAEAARGLVISNLVPNELEVDGSRFEVRTNPQGAGLFVFDPQTRYHGVERQLVWWVTEDGRAFPLNSPSKMVTPDLLWAREVGVQAPATSDVVAFVFEGRPMPEHEAAVKPGDDLAAVSCETKQAARQIATNDNVLELFDLGCRVLQAANVDVVGAEEGLIELRVKRDGTTRWTVSRARQAEATPEVPSAVRRLSLAQRKQIHDAVVRAEDRATREAEARYPVSCATGPVERQQAENNRELTRRLSEQYRTAVLSEHGVSAEGWNAIQEQARREGWPLPDASPMCSE